MIYEDQEFYEDIEEFVERNEQAIIDGCFPNGVTVQECTSEPIHQYTPEDVLNAMMCYIHDDRWPEDIGNMEQQVEKVIRESIKDMDLYKLNEKMPEIWIPTKETTYYSETGLKNILKDYLNG